MDLAAKARSTNSQKNGDRAALITAMIKAKDREEPLHRLKEPKKLKPNKAEPYTTMQLQPIENVDNTVDVGLPLEVTPP